MRTAFSLLLAGIGLGIFGPDTVLFAQATKTKVLAGWFGVFPELPAGYIRSFQLPVVDKDKKNIYRQTAIYEWSGGADKRLEVTLARDPAFEKKYAAKELEKDGKQPMKVRVGKRTGWLWKFDSRADKKTRPLHARMIVPLAADRILRVEARGRGPFEDLVQRVSSFDLDKMEKALDAPPRTDFRRRLESFRQLRKGMSYPLITTWVGDADKDIGSGIHVMVYALDDGSRVLVGFADFNRLLYVKHVAKDGKAEELAK
jgi:hypothetical protein